jgi:protein-tyrosine phosphatase
LIDLHAHILSRIDDGPRDLEESLALARAMVDEGTRTVAATPHVRYDFPAVRPDEIADRCATLQDALDYAQVPLEVVPAGEVDLVWANQADTDDLYQVSYGQVGDYVLIETPYGPLPDTFERLLLRVLERHSIRPVLAHPERNPTFQEDPDRLAALVDEGIVIQVTAPALAHSRRRSRSRRLALDLIDRGLVHLLASDAHGPHVGRRPELARAMSAAAQVAPRRTHWMVNDAPAAVLAGLQIPPPPGDDSHGGRG